MDKPSGTAIPALRILGPMVMGIMAQRWCGQWWVPSLILGAAACCYAILIIRGKSPERRLALRPYLSVLLALSALAVGWLTAIVHDPPCLDSRQRSGIVLTAQVRQVSFTDFSTRLTLRLMNTDLPHCNVLVTTRGCDYSMRAGDMVSWRADLKDVGNRGNPVEMDYASWLLNYHGIRYEQHLPLSQLFKMGYRPTPLTRLTALRRKLSLQILNSRLSPEARRAVAALLLGESGWIDRETRQAFSDAGVAHVLALSGLHVGLVAWLLWLLLFPLDFMGLRRCRLGLTCVAVVFYAVFTGGAASVVRAAVMIVFTMASTLLHRRPFALNALCVAAILILVWTPSALYSAGFQLSFVTVAALLMLQGIPLALKSWHRVVGGLLSVIIVSVVAIIATLSQTAHYFHTVSVAGILTNLLVLPVLPLFMTLGAVLLLVTAAGMCWPALDRCVDLVYSYIQWSVSAVGAIPWLHTGGVYVSTAGTIIYLAALLMAVLWLYQRNYRWLMASGCALALLSCHSLWIDARTPSRGLMMLNSHSSTPLFYFSHGVGYIWSPDNEEEDVASFSQNYNGLLARYRIHDLLMVTDESALPRDEGFIKPPFALLMGHRLAVVDNAYRKNLKTNVDRVQVDDLVMTRRFKGRVTELKKLFDFERLLISGAMQPDAVTALVHECDSLGVEVHSMGEQGAYMIQ